MWRPICGMVPSLLVPREFGHTAQLLRRHQAFQGRQPMVVIRVAQIRIAMGLRECNLLREGLCPFAPGK